MKEIRHLLNLSNKEKGGKRKKTSMPQTFCKQAKREEGEEQPGNESAVHNETMDANHPD